MAFRRLLGGVQQERSESTERNHRGAKAVIDQHAAARLSAVVGDGEFPEHAVAPHGAVALEAARAPAPAGRATPVTAIAAASIVCLWAGARANHDFGNTVAHAAADGGSLGAPTAAAGPMFGAGRDPGDTGGDPAMTPKNSTRMAAMAVAAAVTANDALAGDAVQWRVKDGGNGHWYQLVVPASKINAEDALVASRARGGVLVSIDSASENQFVFALASANPTLWTIAWPGATQIFGPWIGAQYSNGHWQWSDGTPWSFTSWAPGEPNYLPSESAALFMGWAGGPPTNKWNNGEPGWTNWGYIIEWSADCNSDGIVDYGQILTGALADANSNGIPDSCECTTNPSLPSCCPGDIYRNGRVDGADLGALLSEWGPVTPLTNSDLDGNGQVNGADLGILLAHWGPCGD